MKEVADAVRIILAQLAAENQRLRDALTIMRYLDDANERERLLREALPTDARQEEVA